METILGFVAGYLVGTRDGKDGLERMRSSLHSIRTSPEVRKLAADAITLVEAVLHDVDGQVHVAVTPDHDPAADLQRSHGRFLYFAPDEIEPIGPEAAEDPPDPAGSAG